MKQYHLSHESNDQYHADTDFLSNSMLKLLGESPRKFEARYVTKTMEGPSSPAMELGTAVHAAVLEADQFADRYAVAPTENRRTKAYKEWAEGLSEGVKPLTQSEFETIKRCTDALLSHPYVCEILSAPGENETSRRWIESASEVQCKFRPDRICECGIVADVKTTRDLNDGEFEKACANFGYDLQVAHYLAGAEATTNYDTDWVFYFLVVETSEPFRARVYQLDHKAIDFGMKKRTRLLAEYKVRIQSDDWSEFDESDAPAISLPYWYYKQERNREQRYCYS